MNSAEQFLACDLAGGDRQLLSQPSMEQDKKKYVSIGTTVLFTGLFAVGSGGFAFYTVFKAVELSVGLGLVWGAVITNVDRLMLLGIATEVNDEPTANNNTNPNLTHISKKSNTKILKAIPRIVMAAGLGLVLSVPFTLQVFQKEIANEISIENDQKFKDSQAINDKFFSSDLNPLEEKIKTIQSQISELSKDEQKAALKVQDEIDGKSGSGLKGCSISCGQKQKHQADLNKKLNELKNKEEKVTEELNELKRKKQQELDKKMQVQKDADSLGRQLGALHKLGEKNDAHGSSIKHAEHGLHLLFILIETMPVIMKLMSGEGVYERALKQKKSGQIEISEKQICSAKERILQQENFKGSIENTSIQQEKQTALKFRDRIHRQRQIALEKTAPEEIKAGLELVNKMESIYYESIAEKPSIPETAKHSSIYPNAIPISH
jgi:hypothetical protein